MAMEDVAPVGRMESLPAPLALKVSPPSSPSKSPSCHAGRPPTMTFIEHDDSPMTVRTSSTTTATTTSASIDMSQVSSTATSETQPSSPSSRERARNLKLLEKRMRLGKNKPGHTRYQNVERSFKAPEGNVINLQHEQYALTYGMMCGIRDSAGLQKPFKQRLTMDDFMVVDKKIFPANAQLQHPFKFKDYSPDVFRQVRNRFGIDNGDYMLTLSGDFNFIEFMSNSKSGQFFFYSHDGKYMIKTQTKEESKFLRRILPHYYKFVMENPNTLITRFYGMHRVKMHHLRRKMHFVIMASVFSTPLEIHARFDLKGSRIGRHASPKEHARGGQGVLKDNDLLDKGFHLQMGMARRAMFLVQLRKDVEFLKQMKIMDYSLLIGVHDSGYDLHNELYTGTPASPAPETPAPVGISKSLPASPTPPDSFHGDGESRTSRSASLTEQELSETLVQTHARLALSPPCTPTCNDAIAELDLDSDSDDDSTSSECGFGLNFFGDRNSGSLPSTPGSRGSNMAPLSPRLLDTAGQTEYSESVFSKDDGGIYGRDRHGRKNGLVYFMGVIDILQQYNTRKIAETFFKGLRHNRKQISAVNPEFYGDRFIEFMEKHVVQDDTLPSPRPSPSSTAMMDTMPREEAC